MNLFKLPYIIFLLIVVIPLFDHRKLPDIARSVGQSMGVLKKKVRELRDDDSKDFQAQTQQPREGTHYTEPTQSDQTTRSVEDLSQR